MKKDHAFFEYVINDLFVDVEGLKSKAMFGGYGFWKDGKIFGIIAEGKLFFKVGDSNKSDYESKGMKPFSYAGHNGKLYEMSYWEVPESIQENHQELLNWIEKSLQVEKKK